MMRKTLSIVPACRALLAAGLLVAGGAAFAEGNPRDPYEGFNRSMFAVNEVVDKYAAKPVAQAYDRVTPLPVKAAFGNFFGNTGMLWVGVNNALQGKVADAGVDFGRLLINSTIGIFGLFDVASELGLERTTKISARRWPSGESVMAASSSCRPSVRGLARYRRLGRRLCCRSGALLRSHGRARRGDDRSFRRYPRQPAAFRPGGRGSGAR
jgi:hypothetical protein